jgi:acyl-coenzyme A thioesterase PaaI-like protein
MSRAKVPTLYPEHDEPEEKFMNTERLLKAWRRLGGNPLGRWVFNQAVGLTVPYSGSTSPRVQEISPGRARVQLRDKRRIRNHLNSIHAIALANVLELTSGLAMMAALSSDVRGIVRSLEVQYHKKARGLLEVTSDCQPPSSLTENTEFLATAEARDASGDVVSSISVTWILGPTKK